MNGLKLNGTQTLIIEPDGKRVRLVVYKNSIEEVCRKEYLSKLNRFIQSEDERIFKGRFQLFKTSTGIGVEVKSQVAGHIDTNNFLGILKTVILPAHSRL